MAETAVARPALALHAAIEFWFKFFRPEWSSPGERQREGAIERGTFLRGHPAQALGQQELLETVRPRQCAASETTNNQPSGFKVFDANGDVTALVNGSGTVVERYIYDPYGSVTYVNATWSTISSSANAANYLFNPFGCFLASPSRTDKTGSPRHGENPALPRAGSPCCLRSSPLI
jgi:hypothetical protein